MSQLSQLSQLLSDEAVPPEVYVWRDVESCRRLVHRHMARRGNRAGPLGTDRKSLDLWRFEWEESIEILHKLIRIIYKCFNDIYIDAEMIRCVDRRQLMGCR